MRMEDGVEESPGNTDGGEGLHHFEVTGGGCAGESQSFEVDEKRDAAGDGSEEKECDNGGAACA